MLSWRQTWKYKSKVFLEPVKFVPSIYHVPFLVFASSEPVPGLNDGTLLLAFTELRQLLDLVIYGDWSSYISDYGKDKNKYSRVQPQTLLIVLDK